MATQEQLKEKLQEYLDPEEKFQEVFENVFVAGYFVPAQVVDDHHSLTPGESTVVVTSHRLLFVKHGESGGGIFSGERRKTTSVWSTPLGNVLAFSSFKSTPPDENKDGFIIYLPAGLFCRLDVSGSKLDELMSLLRQAAIGTNRWPVSQEDTGALVAIQHKQREDEERRLRDD